MEKHFLGSLPLIEKLVKCDKRELGNGTYRRKHIMLQSAEGNGMYKQRNLKTFSNSLSFSSKADEGEYKKVMKSE